MSPQDIGLIDAVDFRRAVSFQAIHQQQLKWSKIQNIADLPIYQQHIVQQMTIYKASNFFNIAPMTIPHAHLNQHVISNGNRQISKAVRSNAQTSLSASDIFAKPQVRKPAHWIDKLQKNWIATATVLSVAVFGGIGALVNVKDKPAATQPSAKMSVAHPVYHDVAIVKVASVADMTNPITMTERGKKAAVSELQDSNKPRDNHKSQDNKHSAQAEKARAMKKSNKQEESKKAESKKDRKKNANNDDAKADGKNEAKQDQKKKASSSKVDSGQSEKTSSTTKKSTTKDKAVKEKSPKEKDKSPSSKTAPDKKSVKKPDDKANNKTDKKPSNKSNTN